MKARGWEQDREVHKDGEDLWEGAMGALQCLVVEKLRRNQQGRRRTGQRAGKRAQKKWMPEAKQEKCFMKAKGVTYSSAADLLVQGTGN